MFWTVTFRELRVPSVPYVVSGIVALDWNFACVSIPLGGGFDGYPARCDGSLMWSLPEAGEIPDQVRTP